LQYQIALLVDSEFFKTIAIHITSAPKYRHSIESGDSCTVPALLSKYLPSEATS